MNGIDPTTKTFVDFINATDDFWQDDLVTEVSFILHHSLMCFGGCSFEARFDEVSKQLSEASNKVMAGEAFKKGYDSDGPRVSRYNKLNTLACLLEMDLANYAGLWKKEKDLLGEFITYTGVRATEQDAVWEEEFADFLQVLLMGANKYSLNGWLEEEGKGMSHKENHASMFRHLADSHAHNREDYESSLDPLLHLATRALMMYTRKQRRIEHPKDAEE
jgi:hypothetical protein